MPEGDTVWLTANRLHRALAGRPLTTSDFRVPALATVDLAGRRVDEVLARGKHLLTRLEGELTFHSHLRMDGSWYLSRTGGPPPRRHPPHMIRALLANDEWTATGYRVHDLHVVARADEARFVGHLGPDLLGPDWDAARAVANLRTEPDVAIGEALLDQRHLAGVGNMYKAEVLFVERVHPWTRVGDVGDLDRVVATSYRLLRMNRDHPEQSTTGRTARGQEHWVYGRGGEPCLKCGTAIERADQGEPPRARVTFWCPVCQPAP
ncbi:DNA-formamidopyrimidine glycosylase family protein [Jatrophihabitans endophyticus]|uniref:DNA-formamidopyrimidine glycosylase family protein n=1 Tax=Jatrophihabitans endophyticus TaxID=1206085 RepID=UPI0019F180ED|nr:DNA-formamidopyrimidine glycosylase family protein [Jatrophihabitans endophyticus]MBE7187139.1 Fpg/Nei family DNA glycosylase [Jatrophihabitans endophyticus]